MFDKWLVEQALSLLVIHRNYDVDLTSKYAIKRKLALKWKTQGIVIHDRCLNIKIKDRL